MNPALIFGFAQQVFQILMQARVAFPAFGRFIDHNLNRVWPNEIPDVYSLTDLFNKDLIEEGFYKDHMAMHGIKEEWVKALSTSQKTICDIYDLVKLYRREEIDYEQLYEKATFLKITPHDLELFIKASEYFPTPNDLVRFAVREVFTPEIVSEYGLDEDIPAEYLAQAKKAGLPDQVAKWAWASHWELPSVSMGYEMLHRGIISKEQLLTLLRTLDIMPGWREKLIEMSYTLPTRVDIRRMYGVGIYDYAKVVKAYEHRGYSPEDAKDLADFAVRYETDEASDLTKSSVVSAYKKSYIDRSTAESYMRDMGIGSDAITFYLDMADYDKNETQLDTISNNLVEQAKEGGLSLDAVRNTLTELNLPQTYIDYILDRIKTEGKIRKKIPTKSDLENWLESGLIDDEFYMASMVLLGYTKDDIIKYLQQFYFRVGEVKRRFLSIEKYQGWLRFNILSNDEFAAIAADMGISDADIGRLIMETQEQNGY